MAAEGLPLQDSMTAYAFEAKMDFISKVASERVKACITFVLPKKTPSKQLNLSRPRTAWVGYLDG